MTTKKDNKINPWIDYTYTNNNMGSSAYDSINQNYDVVSISTTDHTVVNAVSPVSITDSTTITLGATDSITFGPNESVYIPDNTGYPKPDYIYTSGTSKIQGQRHSIDVDELGDFIETLKRRMLILTPNFEMHEKYPMLKQLYDEYKAMERLLSGPDGDNND